MYDACPEWTDWANWSDCITIPSSFSDADLNENCPPKFRLREKRRCPESQEFCSTVEEEPCACHIAESGEAISIVAGRESELKKKGDIDGLSSASIGKSQDCQNNGIREPFI